MKRILLTNLFMAAALLTSASVFAQSTSSAIEYEIAPINTTHLVSTSHHTKAQDEGDIESDRESKEVEQCQLSETTNDNRFTGRQFRLYSSTYE